MKILIIGSKGFIGKAALNYFSSKGLDVYGCDIQSASETSPESYTCLDKTEPDFAGVFQKTQFNWCLNASGAANVGQSFLDPNEDFRLNTQNVLLLLNAIKDHNPECKFLNLSSAAVYGNPKNLPVTEKHEIHPLSPYGWHKYMSEVICKEFQSVYNLQTFNARIFSAYGPGLRKQLFWDLYQKYQSGKNIELFGTGEESRDYIYIEDLLQALQLIFEKAVFNGGAINIANGIETPIREAASCFFHSLGNNVSFGFNNQKKEGDPDFWKADIRNLSDLGYKQKYIFEQGINEYVKWLKSEE